ncbi:RNA polymerase factor sigma-32 [Pararhodobacter zhoushanensis]|uniref:RNA polymerase factor sigma-32 n=1 Tax=Pararhodobacter zhoushanensis TaxID=2479545 RepID=A0ABT3GTH9_9RHOB|nr:RNA polymerase factor sigma-32 [Pararhodobacter zhoushanensis]MCW1930850.1 RNA polymerase factor sigma-32 [Pararhodobacter zhoushanensis]
MALDSTGTDRMARQAMRAELLDAETEAALARAWRDDRDERALHRLVTAYMRLAISMASRYRRYGAPMGDLIQEAGLGLMKAAERFDPDRGVRFSTYAVWWIKASVQDFVMRNWSMVRTGSTTSQKSLFFNLRRVQAELAREARQLGEDPRPEELLQRAAQRIGVPMHDVLMMDGRLSGGDFSLNAKPSGDDDGQEWIDTIEDDSTLPGESVAHRHDTLVLRDWLAESLAALNPRERAIVAARKLEDEPRTLEALGQELGLSKERVRQIEAAALAKMKHDLVSRAPGVYAFLA